jgi:hypothetical protein
MRVSALRRSLRVPPERMLRKKARSDAEPPVAFGKAEKVESSDACKDDARSSKVAIWEADWETTGLEVVGSGGRKSNQPGEAGMRSFALEDGLLSILGGMYATSRPDGGMMMFGTRISAPTRETPHSILHYRGPRLSRGFNFCLSIHIFTESMQAFNLCYPLRWNAILPSRSNQ